MLTPLKLDMSQALDAHIPPCKEQKNMKSAFTGRDLRQRALVTPSIGSFQAQHVV